MTSDFPLGNQQELAILKAIDSLGQFCLKLHFSHFSAGSDIRGNFFILIQGNLDFLQKSLIPSIRTSSILAIFVFEFLSAFDIRERFNESSSYPSQPDWIFSSVLNCVARNTLKAPFFLLIQISQAQKTTNPIKILQRQVNGMAIA